MSEREENAESYAWKAEDHIRMWPDWLTNGHRGGMTYIYKKGGGVPKATLYFGYDPKGQNRYFRAVDEGAEKSRELTPEELLVFKDVAEREAPNLKLTADLKDAIHEKLIENVRRISSQE